MFNRILIPLDGSESGESILTWIVPLATKLRSEIVLATVIDPDAVRGLGLTQRTDEAPELPPDVIAARDSLWAQHEQDLESANSYLGIVGSRLDEAGIEHTLLVVTGDPEDEIVAAAIANDADLIAMATHRASPVTRGVLGSVADRVLRSSPVPVLMLRPRPSHADAAHDSVSAEVIENIIVPLDLSPNSETALEPAIDLAQAVDARLRILTATSDMLLESPSLGAWHGRFYSGGQLRSDAREYLRPHVEAAEEKGVSAEAVAVSDSPVNGIIRLTRESPGSMVVMAASGISRFRRWMLGSVTDKVVRGAECPVLVLPYLAVSSVRDHDGEVPIVRDVMTTPAITTTGDVSLSQAARIMVDNHIGSLPVVDDSGNLVGMITESLFIPAIRHLPFTREEIYAVFDQSIGATEAFPEALRSLRDRPIGELMNKSRASVTADLPVTDAASLMMRDGVSHLPVHEDGKVIGIVALHDMLHLVAPENT